MILLNIFILFIVKVFVKSLPTNNTDLMTASYSKVSHWNNNTFFNRTNPNEGRSSKGQIFYTHR